MNWTNRYTVRIGSVAFALALLIADAAAARAASTPIYLFDGKALSISHLERAGNDEAIALDDPGLRELLHDVGATVTWNLGERYVLFTTAQPEIVSFAIGDTGYDVGPISSQASFAPYEHGTTVYVPFVELLRGLELAPKREGGAIVIQPQLAAIDVVATGDGVRLVARAGIPLRAHVISQSAERVVYAFDGVGTTLERVQQVQTGGVREIDVAQSGTARDPTTTVTFLLAPGASHAVPSSDDGRDFTLAFSAAGAASDLGSGPSQVAGGTESVAEQQGAAESQGSAQPGAPAENGAPQTPEPLGGAPAEEPQSSPEVPTTVQNGTQPASAAEVTSVSESSVAGGFAIDVAISGDATYAWHHLRPPDNRFWVDVSGAQLHMPARDDPGGGAVQSVRIRQIDPSTVRIALSISGQKRLDVTSNAGGMQIVVYDQDAGTDIARAGNGAIGNAALAANEPLEGASASPQPWKFAPRATPAPYAAPNPRLIVIDPGHGGSDPGTIYGSLEEKNLTLDMAKRLRDILVARGWEVRMTRTTDVDVYKPYDSAHDELQARDDVANNGGARLFVSIHVNGYINAGPNGTTTYYSKPIDVPLARDVQRAVVAAAGTADDGIVKSRLYVTLHATMPAILVETAFLSNPTDYARLDSPAWRQKVAQGIADGIGQYAGSPPPPPQSGDQ